MNYHYKIIVLLYKIFINDLKYTDAQIFGHI
jgi:hypothetical protein